MNREKLLCVLIMAGALTPGAALAAQRVDLHRQDLRDLNTQYHARAARTGIAPMAHTRHEQLLQLEPESYLVLKARRRAGTVRNTRYQQTFRGVPIYGEQVIVSEHDDGSVRTLFGRSVHGLASEIASTRPRLNEKQALAIGHRAALGGRTHVERTQAPLNIFITDDGRAHLAYVVSYFADRAGGGAPTRPVVVVDANTGHVLKQWESLDHALVGTGPGGNTRTGAYEYGSGGRYGYLDVTQSGSTCTMSNADVKTVNLNGGASGSTAHSFTCPRNTVKSINGANSPLNDAHYLGGVVNAMYTAYTGAKPLSMQLVLKVHYSSNVANAWWDGAQVTIGDGDATVHPLVSADILGHEITHGYVDAHADLGTGEAASINEAFSDMGGEATEFYWTGSNDFKMGVEIAKNGVPLRYMDDPTRDNYSIAHYSNYSSGMEKYKAAGIYNKAFYLLATKAGWDTPKAFKAFAKANKDYWTPSTDFNNGACGVEKAATDLGYAVADVSAAFLTVGVDCPGGPGPGPGTTYTNGTDYTINDNSTVDSPITVSGRTGNAPTNASVSVNIIHTYRGDLKVDLVAPDGSLYNISNRAGGSADNLSGTFTFNLSSEPLNGTWKLRVNDNANADVGRIDTWSITF